MANEDEVIAAPEEVTPAEPVLDSGEKNELQKILESKITILNDALGGVLDVLNLANTSETTEAPEFEIAAQHLKSIILSVDQFFARVAAEKKQLNDMIRAQAMKRDQELRRRGKKFIV